MLCFQNFVFSRIRSSRNTLFVTAHFLKVYRFLGTELIIQQSIFEFHTRFFFWDLFQQFSFNEHIILFRERTKQKNQEYIYINELEKASLANKIKFLREQITQLKISIGVADLSLSSSAGGELQFEENGEIKAGSQDKLIEALYIDTGKPCKKRKKVFK